MECKVCSVASLGLVSAGTATDGVTLFFLDNLFSHRPLESDDLFSCRLVTTPVFPRRFYRLFFLNSATKIFYSGVTPVMVPPPLHPAIDATGSTAGLGEVLKSPVSAVTFISCRLNAYDLTPATPRGLEIYIPHNILCWGQGRSQEFTKGDKPRGLRDGSFQRDPGPDYGNPRENQRRRDKNWPTVIRGHAPISPLDTLLVEESRWVYSSKERQLGQRLSAVITHRRTKWCLSGVGKK